MTRRLVFLSLLFPLVAGCDSLYVPGIAVSGRVMFRGKPVTKGTILFRADFFLGGRSAMGEIRDGWYSISRAEGPSDGNFGIEITNTGNLPPNVVGATSEPGIPLRYNQYSEIKIILAKRQSLELMFDLE